MEHRNVFKNQVYSLVTKIFAMKLILPTVLLLITVLLQAQLMLTTSSYT